MTARIGRATVALKPGRLRQPFFLELHPFELDELGIDEHQQVVQLAPKRQIDDEDAERHADLRRRQPDAGCGIHRLDHVVDELLDVGGQLAHVCRSSLQRRLAELQNRANHDRRVVNLACSRSVAVA
jgi:hypothetical protein